jgi:hypothetical protein
MTASAWKKVKEKKSKLSAVSSDTSYMCDVDSDPEFEDFMEERAMNIIKKTKFDQIFKKSLDKGSVYRLDADPDYIYQQYLLKHKEPLLPLPTKVTNGTLAL